MQNKRLIFLICLICFIFACTKEKKSEPQNESGTKLEKFVSRKGITFVRDLYHIKPDISNSSNKALKLEGVDIYEPDKENERLKGLKINVCEKKPAEESEPLACTDYWYLDLDEVENLSKALEYMREFSNEWKNVQREDTSVTYMSKGDFIIRFNQWARGRRRFVQPGRLRLLRRQRRLEVLTVGPRCRRAVSALPASRTRRPDTLRPPINPPGVPGCISEA